MKPIDFDKYSHIVSGIKRKLRWVIASTVIAVILTVIICSPMELFILDKTVVLWEGLSPFLIVLFIIIILFAELVIYSIVLSPMFNSMNNECDPEKHLVLNIELNKQKNINDILCVDYFYLGELSESAEYAEKMIADSRALYKLAGFFHKARNSYFLNDTENFKTAASDYKTALCNTVKLKPKQRAWFEIAEKTIDLMCAITDNDTDKIRLYCDINTSNQSKPQEGYINYLKGVAAYSLGESKQAIYYFMFVKENCEKTFLYTLADEYLQKINI